MEQHLYLQEIIPNKASGLMAAAYAVLTMADCWLQYSLVICIFSQHSLVDSPFCMPLIPFLLPHGTFLKHDKSKVKFTLFFLHECSNSLLKLCSSAEKKLLPTQSVDADLFNNEGMFSCSSQHFFIPSV